MRHARCPVAANRPTFEPVLFLTDTRRSKAQREREGEHGRSITELSGGRVLEVAVSGKLTPSDYEQFVPAFERLVKQHAKIRVLFEMKDFRGWEMAALWDDIKFDLKHFADIERLAMVGDKQWERGMAAFCRPFTSATVRYFNRGSIDEARRWLVSQITSGVT
jgi:hypothetical protein